MASGRARMVDVPSAMLANGGLPGGDLGVQGDEGRPEQLGPWPLGLPPRGGEDDLIELVLEGVHRGSKFRSPFMSASTSEAKARAYLREAHTFRNAYTGPDETAYLRRIDLSKLHAGQVIPFANPPQQQRLVQTRSSDARFSKYFTQLDPRDVQPSKEGTKMSEYLLVARGFIPESLFEKVPPRTRSEGP